MGHDTPLTSLLSPDQVFDFYQALPSAAEIDRRKSQALASLRAWVQAHPDLTRRPPAEYLLVWVLNSVDRAELKEVDHPVLGTWRFTLQVPGDSAFTFYARTEPYPTNRWTPSRTRRESVPTELQLPPAGGYGFVVVITDRLEELPEMYQDRIRYRQGYLNALAHADATGAGGTIWRGWIESSLLRQAIPDDPRVQRAAAEAFERFGSRYRQGLPYETPAQFARGADGVLRVRQSFPLSGEEDLILEGEQVSRTVIQIRR